MCFGDFEARTYTKIFPHSDSLSWSLRSLGSNTLLCIIPVPICLHGEIPVVLTQGAGAVLMNVNLGDLNAAFTVMHGIVLT